MAGEGKEGGVVGRRSPMGRLSVMMFLEYGVRGMWFPFLANYLAAAKAGGGLGLSSGQVGWVLGFANALGAVTAPLVAGQVADRYLNAERALAGLQLVSGVLLLATASASSFWSLFLLMLLFSVAYVPTQSLTNSLALAHLSDRERAFPRVRLWGTIGWVVTSASFTYLVLNSADRAVNTARIPWALRAAGAMAVAYAVYSLVALPKTPPKKQGHSSLALGRAVGVFRERSVLALVLVALPVAAIHTAYYLNIGPFLEASVGVPLRWVGPAVAISQVSEVAFLFWLGPMLRRWGYRIILTVGAAAQAARFVMFALEPAPWVVLVSLTLHGVAFACFFTTAVLYVERAAPADVRHSVQTVFGIVLFGLGPALAGPYSEFFDRFTVNGRVDYRVVWGVQAVVAAVSAVGIWVGFRVKERADEGRGADGDYSQLGSEMPPGKPGAK